MKINIAIPVCILLFFASFRTVAKTQAQTVTVTQTGAFAYSVVGSIPVLTNTTVNTQLYGVTIPAGILGTAKHLHLTMISTITSGLLPPTMTLAVNFGGQALNVVTGLSINASLTAAPFTLDVDIYENNSTNSQVAIAEVRQSTVSGPLTLTTSVFQQAGTWAVDATQNQTLAVSAKFGTAVATTTLTPLLMSIKME